MNEEIAVLKSRKEPTLQQLNKLNSFLENKYDKKISIEWEEDPSVINGFILKCGTDVYDWSISGRIKQFQDEVSKISIDNKNYISLLEEMSQEWKPKSEAKEVGNIIYVGDGIAKISGLEHVQYNEIVIFSSGVKGMVLDIKEDEVGCIILGDDRSIEAGETVYRTERTAAISVGDEILGRVVDSLGTPIDGEGDISTKTYYPIERKAPLILERQPVYRPIETGILAIDSMFPIGRGQRELIIGDRQTGKTAIAIDTIINQKGKDVICVYVAIGQKAGSVARLVENLRMHDALSYTTVICATAGDSAALQYLAPYSGTAIAEYFMDQGNDVLVVYDDLSKHAVSYRSLSLLLERFPGREAFPGDVFYLHSRLLERSAQMNAEKGNGSITALPIVETQKGDISAYIPTNIISITDGQIFLETELFFSGQRPAINVGLSVSRVGGSAQTKAIKKASHSLKLVLSQYREMAVFTQFASDLDEATKRQLHFGESLMELLKQGQYHPWEQHQEVIMLVVALEGLLINTKISKVSENMRSIIEYVEDKYAEGMNQIDHTGTLTDDVYKNILKFAGEALNKL